MKKISFCALWIALLPLWAVSAILHTASALLTRGLSYLEETFGNSMDEVEWEIKNISLEKTK